MNFLQKRLNSFLWNNKPDKISRKIAKQDKTRGGLGMIDVQRFLLALKLTWVRKILQPNENRWKYVALSVFPKLHHIQLLGSTFAHTLAKNINNQFWKDVLVAYKTYTDTFVPRNINEALSMSFLFQPGVTLDTSTIDTQILINNNITYLHQLVHRQTWITYTDFTVKYNIRLNYLSFYSIIHACKAFIQSFYFNVEENDTTPDNPFYLTDLIRTKKGCSCLYARLQNEVTTPKGMGKWFKKFNNSVEPDQVFKHLLLTTKDSQLQWFQFRILHNILSTNLLMSKMGKDQTDTCTLCGDHSETISHLLWSCEISQRFWNSLQNLLISKCTHVDLNGFIYNEELITLGLLNNFSVDRIFYLITLLGKFHIYKCKVNKAKPSLTFFIPFVKRYHDVECTIHHKNKAEWSPYEFIFT